MSAAPDPSPSATFPSGRKHLEISRSLRDAIVSGKHPAGSRLPSEAQLVKRFGASRPTVARALRTLETEGLVTRRAGSGTFATGGAPGMRAATRTLALLIPDLRNTEIFQQIAGEIATLARVNDYSLIWGGSGQPKLDADVSLQHGEELCEQFIAKRVDGVFFTPYELVPGPSESNARMARSLHDAGIPVVLIDRDYVPFPSRSKFDLVGVDNLDGGFALAEHLIKLRCQSICFVHPAHSAPTISARIAGVRAALDKHGLTWSADRVFEGNPADPAFLQHILRQAKPDALVGGNDHTAALLLQTLTKLRIAVPQKVRVVGFDDVAFATLVSPALTTVQQPCREIAVTAYRTMMDRLADPALPPRHIMLSPRLLIRDSCGAYL